ncbi:MAG: S-layer homology domain-containing protein [Clostridia bacterium]
MKAKKIIAVLLLFTLLLSLFSVSTFAAVKTVQSKAEVLNALKILQGDGKDYLLQKTLTRGEAAKFMVSLMGKEAEVLANKTKYITKAATLKDMQNAAKLWYTPYIGYCLENGIITGYTDQTFKPKELVNEQSFLRMILGVVGYNPLKGDFTWGDVFVFAYNHQIVTDARYAINAVVNKNFQRANAVEIIYQALIVPGKNARPLIMQLVDQGTVQKNIAISLGLWSDISPSAITTTTVVNPNQLIISFNEPILALTQNQVKITEVSDSTKNLQLKTAPVALDEKTYVITTYNQKENMPYKISLTNVTDKDSNIIPAVSTTFKGYLVPTITSTNLMLSKVTTISNQRIKISFTQNIDVKTEIAMLYKITADGADFVAGSNKTMVVERSASDPRAVYLTLLEPTKKFVDGVQYTLIVSGDLSTADGKFMGLGNGDEADFYYSTILEEPVSVQSASFVAEDFLEVVFNREVDPITATKLSNYQLKTSAGVSKTVVSANVLKDGKTLRLLFSPKLVAEETLTLLVQNVQANFGTVPMLATSKSVFFSPNNIVMLFLTGAVAKDDQTVEIGFSRAPQAESVVKNFYYEVRDTISGSVIEPVRIIYDAINSPLKATLYFNSKMTQDKSYQLRLKSGMLDEYGKLADASTVTFLGSSIIRQQITMTKASYIDNGTIEITLSGAAEQANQMILAENYKLEAKVGASILSLSCTGVRFIGPDKILVFFDGMETSKSYTLRAGQLTDISGLLVNTTDVAIAVTN